ncbi:E3 ubiquitin-protein ligase parkin [Condylostylus longicornis]|uniref:E3 ubiquitin-protein ligase parkin n=1 Tax=Condylostylus longicornis TaxID=2530218 RepID=UPI00244E0C70|nr:E3 ubiquitin-protein ligase parkin [Condylostylus longicornis]
MSFILNFLRSIIENVLQLLSFGKKSITNTLSIYIKTNTGCTLAVDLDPKWDIKNIKQIIAPQLGLQPCEVKIIFAGKELCDSTVVEECDLGQRSIIHAIKTRRISDNFSKNIISDSNDEVNFYDDHEHCSKPLCETLVDLQLEKEDRLNILPEEREKKRAHFFVYCVKCKKLCIGKLRVRCSKCKGGAFTVHRDPECWEDVLKPRKIRGHCESNDEVVCVDNEQGDPPFAEFYFKCAEHTSEGEKDYAIPLNLVKHNIKGVPCLACTDVSENVLVFPCKERHVTCLECFRNYCLSRLMERQYVSNPDIGYTLPCPAGCEESFIEEIHHFNLLASDEYERYLRFATEEYVLQAGGVLCPQPGCGMGLITEADCLKVTCQHGCNYVFCKNCLQGYHIGECLQDNSLSTDLGSCDYVIDPSKAAEARWEEANKVIIKTSTKPCPKCRTPTERDGGCMHMVCTRSGCGFEWCWICQTGWTRDCMGAHWFG